MVTLQQVTELIAQLGGLAMFAGMLAAIAAFVYRWYVREKIPRGLGLLVGLAGVAVLLNTTAVLGQVIVGGGDATETQVALFNITAFLVGGGGATVGQWAGDWFGSEVFLGRSLATVEGDVGRLVQSVGRVIAVELPPDIDDVVGYDPVPEETKETLAGKTFLFPRRLTVGELRDRLVDRLKTDYGVGHVDIELAADGSVEYLALGSRAAGIGPTLPPATNAVAIRADPAFAASAGDLVQVWETDPMRRVLTAELRGVADDTVTVAIDAADTQKIDPTEEYRLVTLPVEDRPDREFASLLRAADETFSSVTVETGSPLHGLPVAALDLSVVAVKPEDGTPKALPDPSTVLAPGDVVFAIARPDALRRLEAAAKPLDPSLVSGPTPPQQRPRKSATGEEAATGSEPPASEATDRPAESTREGDKAATTDVAEPTATPDSESVDDENDEETDTDSGDSTGEKSASSDFDQPAATDDSAPEKAGRSSFQNLKEEFESGDADWADEEEREDDESAGAAGSDDESETTDDDGLGGALDEAGDDLISLDSGDGEDDSDLDFEDEDDDLSSLSFDDEEDEGLSFDDEEESEDDEDDDDEEGADDEDDDDDDNSGGGASSFQDLKEEFESGDADWEDDISDSPGGDMRLDE